jgi:SAM-dependent methyltransferase
MTLTHLKNQTRITLDFGAAFRKRGRFDLILLQRLLETSRLAREGIRNSGSYRFADHLYQGRPRGAWLIGSLLDALLLWSPAARTMRRRYLFSVELMLEHFRIRSRQSFHILGVPCGIPRDVADVFRRLPLNQRGSLIYTGIDRDPDALRDAAAFLSRQRFGPNTFLEGDALDPVSYPKASFDFAVSTGFGEFLTDAELTAFCRNVHAALAPGGVFYISALTDIGPLRHLLETFELTATYRQSEHFCRLVAAPGWHSTRFIHEKRQVYAILCK